MEQPNSKIRKSAIKLNPELSANELNAIKSLLKDNPMRGNHLEIGTAAGGTLRELLLSYERPRPKFVVVDPFTYYPNQLEIVKRNLSESGLGDEPVEFREGYSWPLCKQALKKGDSYDFIFVDGDHGPNHVIQDLRWTRMLKQGGFVCLHDYRPNFPGVVWAVEYFLKKHPNFKKINHVDSLVILQKESVGSPEVSWSHLLAGEVYNKVTTLKKSILKRLKRIGLT